MLPRTTGQGVGGSSGTGEKLSDRTWRGSTEGRKRGGSMKLFIITSNALQKVVAKVCTGSVVLTAEITTDRG